MDRTEVDQQQKHRQKMGNLIILNELKLMKNSNDPPRKIDFYS